MGPCRFMTLFVDDHDPPTKAPDRTSRSVAGTVKRDGTFRRSEDIDDREIEASTAASTTCGDPSLPKATLRVLSLSSACSGVASK